jgi:GT2 family glycosyltransferase
LVDSIAQQGRAILTTMQLSIIISTHKRPESLGRLLSSLAPQIRPEKHALFIAENGTPIPSSLPTVLTDVVHLHDPRAGKCRAQNRAIALARGDVLVFLDDDVVAAAGYLAAVEQFFADHPEFAAMKGRILPAEDPVRKLGAVACYAGLPLVDHGEKVMEVRGVVGANMAFRAQALAQVGGFDERLGPGAVGDEEETEMCARLRRAGMRIGYAPQAIVYHEVDPRRAQRALFLQSARKRGLSRMMHERHALTEVAFDNLIAIVRLTVARSLRVTPERLAREEHRAAVARGMLDGALRGLGRRSGDGTG